MSSSVYIVYSVTQGSVLVPLLFIVYTADFAAVAENHSVPLHVFADETAVFSLLSCRHGVSCCPVGMMHWRWWPLDVHRPTQAQHGFDWVAVGQIETQHARLSPSSVTARSQLHCSPRSRLCTESDAIVRRHLVFDKHASAVSVSRFYWLLQLRQSRRSFYKVSALTLIMRWLLQRSSSGCTESDDHQVGKLQRV